MFQNSHMENLKVSELLVADLRRELDRVRLEKTGLKPALVERLRNALSHNGERADKIVVDQEEDTKQPKPARKEELDAEDASSYADRESREESDGLIRAKTLSRAAIEGLALESSKGDHQKEGTPSCSSTCSTAGSHTGSDVDSTTCHEGCQLGAMAKQVREPTHFPEYVLHPLLSKNESLTHVIEEERKEARETEQQLLSKISELEKIIMILPKIDQLSKSVEKGREEAKDREQRLSTKIRELEKTINTSVQESYTKCSNKIDKAPTEPKPGKAGSKPYKRVRTTKNITIGVGA